MKKFLIIIGTCLVLTSCSRTIKFNENITLTPVESHMGKTILVDTTTDVIYYERRAGYSYSITPLFNADGSLRTHEQIYGVRYSEK